MRAYNLYLSNTEQAPRAEGAKRKPSVVNKRRRSPENAQTQRFSDPLREPSDVGDDTRPLEDTNILEQFRQIAGEGGGSATSKFDRAHTVEVDNPLGWRPGERPAPIDATGGWPREQGPFERRLKDLAGRDNALREELTEVFDAFDIDTRNVRDKDIVESRLKSLKNRLNQALRTQSVDELRALLGDTRFRRGINFLESHKT